MPALDAVLSLGESELVEELDVDDASMEARPGDGDKADVYNAAIALIVII